MRQKLFLPFFISLIAIQLWAMPDGSRAAREYKPVDQLGHGATLQSITRKATPTHARSAPRRQPESPATWVTPSGNPKLFGTVEFQRPLNTLPGWLDVLKRNKADPVFYPEKYFINKTTWNDFRQKASSKSQMDMLSYVNNFWNRNPYREDMQNWHLADYWEIPAEFIKKSGDCEDYAITKYFTLKELGIPAEKMRIVVLRDTVRNEAHAVLAVFLNDDVYILDNITNIVLSHKRLRNYLPQYSVNEFGRWMHIKGKS